MVIMLNKLPVNQIWLIFWSIIISLPSEIYSKAHLNIKVWNDTINHLNTKTNRYQGIETFVPGEVNGYSGGGPRIVGGSPQDIEKFPFHVSKYKTSKLRQQLHSVILCFLVRKSLCGSSLACASASNNMAQN